MKALADGHPRRHRGFKNGTDLRLRHGEGLRAAAQVGLRAAPGVDEEQVIATNGSMQADAFLFEPLREAGRPGGGRGAHVRPHAALAAPAQRRGSPDWPRGRRHRRQSCRPAPARGGPARAPPRDPQLPEPRGLHPVPRQAPPPSRAGRGARLPQHLRGDPYVELRFEGERLPTMFSMDSGGRVAYACMHSRFRCCPGIRVGYLVGPGDLIARVRTLATNTYISPEVVAQAIVAEVLSLVTVDGSIATVRTALHHRRDALAESLRPRRPRRRLRISRGGFHVGDPARGRGRRRPGRGRS